MKKDLQTLEREVGEYRAEARAILDRVGDNDLSGDDAARFDTLTGQIESHNDEIRAVQERHRQYELIRSAGRPGSTMMTEGEGSGVQPYGRTEDRTPQDLQRDTAMRTVDGLHTRGLLTDGSAERAEGLAQRDMWARQWIAAAGADDYATAFAKLLADPQRGHLRWTPQEHAAYQRVEQVRDHQRAMSLTGSAGGHMVPVHLDPAIIITNAGNINPIRSLARTVTITGTQWRGVSSAGATAEWLPEATEAADGSPTLAQPTITAHKYSVFVPFSVEIEGDAMNFVSELQQVLSDSVNNLHATAFTTGAGDSSDQPFGIVTALAAAGGSIIVPGGGSEALDDGDPYLLQNALPARWQANSRWTAALPTINAWRQAETDNGSLKYPGLHADPAMLLGRGMFENSNMDAAVNAAASEANYLALLGDWNQYVIADRVGSTVEIVQHLVGENGRPTGERGMWLWGRVGANAVVPSAFRMLNVATTA